jgi:hypothetical protein
MAVKPRKPHTRAALERLYRRDPLGMLSLGILCDYPDIEDLSPEQQYALHEFFHAVLVAGYRLYQVVPPEKAALIMIKKFAMIIEGTGGRKK